MAKWKDLPTEIKENVLELLVGDERARAGREAHSSEVGRALLALTSVDRELHVLVAPLLWHTIEFTKHHEARLQSFAADVGPSKGFLVKLLILIDETRGHGFTRADSYATVLATLPRLQRLSLSCSQTTAIGLLPLLQTALPPTLRTLRLKSFQIVGHMDALAAASFIRALPQLVEVELSDFNWVRGDGGARLTFDVLRGLEKIQSLRLAGCAPLRPSLLTQPWRSSLTSLDLAEDDNSNMPSLQVMLVHHGETLRSLSLPPYRDQDHFPPFSLPHLDHLKLSLTQRSAALPLAFSTAPLRKLEVRMVGLH